MKQSFWVMTGCCTWKIYCTAYHLTASQLLNHKIGFRSLVALLINSDIFLTNFFCVCPVASCTVFCPWWSAPETLTRTRDPTTTKGKEICPQLIFLSLIINKGWRMLSLPVENAVHVVLSKREIRKKWFTKDETRFCIGVKLAAPQRSCQLGRVREVWNRPANDNTSEIQ